MIDLTRYAFLTKYVAIGAACLAAFLWYRHQVNSAYADGVTEGHVQERAEWLSRESKELLQANTKLHELEERYRALEAKSVQDVAAASAKAQTEIDHAKAQAAAAVADRNRYRLRWSTECVPSEGSDRSVAAAPGAAPSGARQTATCELPESVRRDLIGLALEANTVVAERNWLLEIAQKDREVCK